jgi:hypothetical protein
MKIVLFSVQITWLLYGYFDTYLGRQEVEDLSLNSRLGKTSARIKKYMIQKTEGRF